jgi:hypothetical protein
MSGRPAGRSTPRGREVARWCLVIALLPWCAVGREPGDTGPLEFHRVHVPGERINEVPLGPVRYVPMPLAEFDAAVARLEAAREETASARPVPLAEAVRYEARIDERGLLVGSIVMTVDADTAAVSGAIPIGDLPARGSLLRTTGPDGSEGLVFAAPDGRFALRVGEPGDYRIDVSCRPVAVGSARFRLPLVPALASSINLELATDLWPLLPAAAARYAVVLPPDAVRSAWRIELGPGADGDLVIGPLAAVRPGLRVWSTHVVRGGETAVAAVVEPVGVWPRGTVELEHEPGLVVTSIAPADGGDALEPRSLSERAVAVAIPSWLTGRSTALVIRGIAPAAESMRRLPLMRPPAQRWAGGGMRVVVDPMLAVTRVDAEEARIVGPRSADAWPLPAPEGMEERLVGSASIGSEGRRPAIFHVEPQGPGALLTIDTAPRRPALDVARVTTVEISSGAVLGRAACDVRVLDGAAYDVVARIAPGWIIDAVDAVEWPDAAAAEVGGPRPVPAGDTAPDWRIVRSPSGNLLRIGLAVGATPSRGLGLRISGHRPAIAAGTPFTTADIDMVRFAGESSDSAVLDFKTVSDSVVEIAGEPVGWFPVEGRLAALVEDGTLRGRIRVGDQSPSRTARVVRRRPPLDARVAVRIDVRDEMLLETFTFACRAEAGAIDALVVHFSEPMGESLEWTALAPPGVTLAARRLDPADARRAGGGLEGISDSWLVECSPPIAEQARIRAVRSVPFSGPTPVPLTWVESARLPRGTVAVVATGARRPRLVNRRLRELPADPVSGPPASRVLEFAYGPPTAPDGSAAAELAPADEIDARAWAWVEQVRCRCHESGVTECQSRFELENHGRGDVVVAVPAGRTVEGIAVDGIPVPTDAVGARGGTVRVPLPSARRRVELLVRTVARADPSRGVWRVDPLGCTVDLPVLDRSIAFLLPPGLEVGPPVAGYRPLAEGAVGWTERLLGARPTWPPGLEPDPSAFGHEDPAEAREGFREVPFTVTVGHLTSSGVLVLSRRLLVSVALLVACACAAVTLATAVRQPRFAMAVCVAAAVGCLWVPPPFLGIARLALWAAVGGACVARLLALPATVSAVIAVTAIASMPSSASAQSPPAAAVTTERGVADPVGSRDAGTQVFITRTARDETMALVPEPLFRLLADASAGAGSPARVVGCAVIVPQADAADAWRVVVDLDTDAGATLVLDQAADGGRWVPPGEAGLPAGVLVRVEGARVRITTAVAGRHRVPLSVMPAVRREGGVETAEAGIPVAPNATLRVVDEVDATIRRSAGGLVCESAPAGGPFMPAPELVAGLGEAAFDVSGAMRVRMVRPLDPRERLATNAAVLAATNQLEWGGDTCLLDAAFDIDSGADILRSFVIRGDERLVDLGGSSDGTSLRLHRLEAGRWLAELPAPRQGRLALRLRARMPLADPVGVFDVPSIDLETGGMDRPTLRLSAAADLEAVLDMPATAAAAATDTSGRQRQRVTVRRRQQPPRGVQTLAVEFAEDRIGLTLRSQIEAPTTALLQLAVEVPEACVVDRLRLTDEEAAQPVDLVWSRTAADRVTAIVQQPRAGRFRLEVDGRIPGAPAARARLPLMRADLAGGAPLLVTWRAERPGRLVIPAGPDEAPRGEVSGTLEIGDREPAVGYHYRLAPEGSRRSEPAEPQPTEAAEAAHGDDRVEATEVFLAFDGHGRARGIVQFDVVTADPVLRIRLPGTARPYDVLVDGVEALAVPRDAGTWEIALHDVGWPRSVLVLFASDFGPGIARGEPLELVPPAVEGLPASAVLWTLEPPRGSMLRLSEEMTADPDPDRWRRERRDAVASVFEASLAAGGTERERLEALARLRRDGRSLPLETAWQEAVGWRGAAPGTIRRLVEPGSPSLMVRVARRRDGSVPARAIASALLLVAFGLVSFVRRRRGSAMPRSRSWGRRFVLPLATSIAGVAWALMLAPAWPGWLIAVGGLAVFLWRDVPTRRRPPTGAGPRDPTALLPGA